jgi:hypothetical protein
VSRRRNLPIYQEDVLERRIIRARHLWIFGTPNREHPPNYRAKPRNRQIEFTPRSRENKSAQPASVSNHAAPVLYGDFDSEYLGE